MIDSGTPCMVGLDVAAVITMLDATGGGGRDNGNKTTPTPRHHHLA